MKQLKKYKVRFIGTSVIVEIEAQSEKEAKQKFTDMHNVPITSYITIVRN